MVPESLITIREYATADLAAPDKALLDEAGVTVYLGGTQFRGHGPVQLRVPEGELDVARDVLGIEGPAHERPEFRCPQCGSAALEAKFPWTMVSMAVFLIGLAGLSAKGQLRIAAFAVPIALVVVAAIDRLAPRWQCGLCGARLRELPKPHEG